MSSRSCVSLLLFALVACVRGYSLMPPVYERPELCVDMFPLGHNTTAMPNPTPYRVIYNTNGCYSTSAKPVYVTAYHYQDGGYHEGIFVQARLASGANTLSYGTFDAAGESLLAPLSCSGYTNNTIGHSGHAHFARQTFAWFPPNGFNQDIQFVATLVRNVKTFWVKVPSSVLRFDANCQNFAVTPPSIETTTPSRLTTTTTTLGPPVSAATNHLTSTLLGLSTFASIQFMFALILQ